MCGHLTRVGARCTLPPMGAPDWFVGMLGWKAATAKATPRCVKLFGSSVGPNIADLSSTSSAAVAGETYRLLGIPTDRITTQDLSDDETPSASGTVLEKLLESDLRSGLRRLQPDRDWAATRAGSVSQFSQFSHLGELQDLFESVPLLRSALGRDYEVSTDVMISLPDPERDSTARVLHAAVSSKFTIRSDRVQNVRHEFSVLVRNRKGRLPHLVLVTAEPMPSRLVSIARGTGEIDAVYHLLYDELDVVLGGERLPSMTPRSWRDQSDAWSEMVSQKRIRPYSDLIPVLALG